jgi:hypothetical protein
MLVLGIVVMLTVWISHFEQLSRERGVGVFVIFSVPILLQAAGFALALTARSPVLRTILCVALGIPMYWFGAFLGITLAVRLGLAKL